MIKMKKTVIYWIVSFVACCFLNISAVVNALTVYVPDDWPEGAISDYYPGKLVKKDGNYSPLDVIKFVNDYLWFAIGFVCFLFVVVNWIKLIISRWDEQETAKAMKALLWCAVWILICLSAYIIVNLAIRLFA